MGACAHRVKFEVNVDIEGQDLSAQEVFHTLKLTEDDIDKLFAYFRLIDRDGSGNISCAEMFSKFGLRGSKLDVHIFRFFDEGIAVYLKRSVLNCSDRRFW